MSDLNRDRAAMYARADYFAWSARRPYPPVGNDPVGGRPWPLWGSLGTVARNIGAAMDAAAARECYRMARQYPNPLERLEELARG